MMRAKPVTGALKMFVRLFAPSLGCSSMIPVYLHEDSQMNDQAYT
jgi:hypothetical protein